MRDDFPKATKETLAKRAGNRCSNPACTQLTAGPHSDPDKSINLGVAAHISAAAEGGKRYNSYLTPEQRKSILNGIWLCQTCAHLIDTDAAAFPEELLHHWKRQHEESILKELCTGDSFPGFLESALITTKIQVMPTGDRRSCLLFLELQNNCLHDLSIRELRLKTLEFRSHRPMGQAESSLVATIDIGAITKYGKLHSTPFRRVLKPNAADTFSVALTAPRLSGIFCSWRLAIGLKADQGLISIGEFEVSLPGQSPGNEGSFAEFRKSFREVYRENKQGIRWYERLLLFVRDPFWLRGYSFHYLPPMMYYSGPRNFLKDP